MARPTKKELWKQAISEKVTKLTPEVVKKLKEAFAIDCTITEACFYAEISTPTYYSWIKKNPELLNEFDRMRETLPLKAKHNIASSIQKGEVGLSERYLSRRQPEFYGDKLKIEHSGSLEQGTPTHKEDLEATERYYKELEANRIKRSREQAIKDGEIKEEKKYDEQTPANTN